MIARAAKNFSYFWGVIISGALFAFMHGSPMQLVHQFFVGVVCSLVYYMSGSIWISALVHFFNNAITLISGYVIFKITGSSDLTMPWWAMLLLCVAGICGLFFSLFGMYKISYAKRKKEDALVCDGENDAEEVVYTGKRKALKVFNEKMDYLFISPEQRAQEKANATRSTNLPKNTRKRKRKYFYLCDRKEKRKISTKTAIIC